MTFGVLELGILLFVVFLVLGPNRIRNMVVALGRGTRDFIGELNGEKKSISGEGEEDRDDERGTP